MNKHLDSWLTYHLWQAITAPDIRHPLFRRALRRPKYPRKFSWHWFGFICLVLVIGAFLFPFVLIPISFIVALSIFLMLFLFSGSTLGLYWSGAITDLLQREGAGSNDDLLGVLPLGKFGADWTSAIGRIHREEWLYTGTRLIKKGLIVIFIILMMTLLPMIPNALIVDVSNAQINFLKDILWMIGLVIFVGMDFIQSIILSVCVAIIVSARLQDQMLAPWITRTFYFFMQVVTYMVALMTYGLLERVLEALVMHPIISHLVVIVLSLLGFMLIREGILRYLWQVILSQYHLSHGDEYRTIIENKTKQ